MLSARTEQNTALQIEHAQLADMVVIERNIEYDLSIRDSIGLTGVKNSVTDDGRTSTENEKQA